MDDAVLLVRRVLWRAAERCGRALLDASGYEFTSHRKGKRNVCAKPRARAERLLGFRPHSHHNAQGKRLLITVG